jgi:HEPN domain-containing protein
MLITPQQRAENAIALYLQENEDLNGSLVHLYSDFENEDLRLILADFHNYVNCLLFEIRKAVNNFYSSLYYDFRRYTETIWGKIDVFIELLMKFENTNLQFYLDENYAKILDFLNKDSFDKNILKCDIYVIFPIFYKTKLKPIDTIYIEKIQPGIIQDTYKTAIKRYNEGDYDGLMTSCGTLLQKLYKQILDNNNVDYGENPDLPELWGKVKKVLELNFTNNPNDFEKRLNEIVNSLGNISTKINEIRNNNSDSHSKNPINCDKIQANLILNSTLTLAETLLCLAEEKQNNVKEEVPL